MDDLEFSVKNASIGRASIDLRESISKELKLQKLKELEEIDFLCSIDRNQDEVRDKVQEAYRRDPQLFIEYFKLTPEEQ